MIERFLKVLNDLGNCTDIEMTAAAELAADLNSLIDLEVDQLRTYLFMKFCLSLNHAAAVSQSQCHCL